MFHSSNLLSSLGGIILSFQLFGHVVGLRSQNNLHNLNVTIRRNARFEEAEVFILNSFPDMSYEQCVLECGSRPGCQAVEYRLSAKYCSLMSDTSNTVRTPGFLIVSDFDGMRLCGNTTCSKREVCDPNTNTCMVKVSLVLRDHHKEEYNAVYKTGDSLIQEVFQKRTDGSVEFYRTWDAYKRGFGDILGEFWFGLEQLYTNLNSTSAQFELRIDLEDWDGNTRFAVYDSFDLGAESDGYRLHCGNYAGTAGDALNFIVIREDKVKNGPHDGQMFTTYDRDNDQSTDTCANRYHGAWWYSRCHRSNLNGRYYVGGNAKKYATGVTWYPWKGHFYSLRRTAMKIREKC